MRVQRGCFSVRGEDIDLVVGWVHFSAWVSAVLRLGQAPLIFASPPLHVIQDRQDEGHGQKYKTSYDSCDGTGSKERVSSSMGGRVLGHYVRHGEQRIDERQ